MMVGRLLISVALIQTLTQYSFIHSLTHRSFGDYFKEGAIDMAWKCLTEEFGLDPERLYATYFGGDEDSPCDTEARDLWLKYLPASRVLPFDAKDNFWEMGATGPCGPCTVSACVKRMPSSEGRLLEAQ